MLTSIDVNFIFDSARLGLFSSANILQIADVALRVVFLLFLLSKRVKCPPFLFSHQKQLNLVSRFISVNGALRPARKLHF